MVLSKIYQAEIVIRYTLTRVSMIPNRVLQRIEGSRMAVWHCKSNIQQAWHSKRVFICFPSSACPATDIIFLCSHEASPNLRKGHIVEGFVSEKVTAVTTPTPQAAFLTGFVEQASPPLGGQGDSTVIALHKTFPGRLDKNHRFNIGGKCPLHVGQGDHFFSAGIGLIKCLAEQ